MAFDSRLLSGIQVLVAAVEAGSFARAAATLRDHSIRREPRGCAARAARRHPAVRSHCACRRAHRRGTQLLINEFKPLLTGIEDAATDAAGSAAVVRGQLRINADPFFARVVLARRLGKFLAAYPELSVEIVGRDRLGDLVADGFDAAVRFGEPEPSALVARRLLETRVLTCAAPSYLAAHGRPAHPRDLARGRTNASTTWTLSLGGRFPGNFTAAGRNCKSRFLAA